MNTEIVNAFRSIRALVVGDVMLDRYWIGDVERISPESPVPVVEVTDTSDCLGGAGNVAANIAAFATRCKLLSIVGNDVSGNRIINLLDESNIVGALQIDAAIRTTEKLRIVARNQQLLRVDFEDKPDHEILLALTKDYEDSLASTDVVVMSDYGKGGLKHIKRMIQKANELNTPVIVDPKGVDFSKYHGATIVTPNLKEFSAAGGDVSSEQAMADSALKMIKKNSFNSLLVTRSKDGMTLFREDGSRIHSPATAREVFDVSGAGDTVVAIIALSIANNLASDAMLELCNSAASYVVSRFGTAIVNPLTLDSNVVPEM